MANRIHAHVRSNVVGYVAIFLFAIGGTAYATHPGGANTISSGDIINEEVRSPDIGPGEVASTDIANDTVSTVDIGTDEVTAADIDTGAVRASEIAAGAVTSGDVLDDTLTAADLGLGSVGTSEIADQTVTGTDLAGTGFGNNGFNGDEEIIDGSLTGFDIGSSELGGGHIADGSLSGADISDGTLNGADIADEPASGAAQNASVVTVAGGAGTDVVSASITPEATSQVVINGTAELQGAESDERVLCRILLDGSQVSLSYESTFDDIGTGNEATVAVNSFANGVAPGAHTVTMNCISLAGTVVKDDAGINAIAIP